MTDKVIGKLSPISTYSAHLTELPVLETHVVQLGSGDLEMKSLRIFGQDSVIIRLKIAPLLTGHHVGDPEWIGFMFPLSWEGEYVFNGKTARPGDVFLTSSRNGYFNVGKKRNTLMFAVRKSRVLNLACAMTGLVPDEIDLNDRVMSFGREGLANFERMFLPAIEAAERTEFSSTTAYLPKLAETDLLESFVRHILPHLTNFQLSTASRERRSAVEVVRRAEERLETGPIGTIGMSDLCQAAGVGITRLTECYHELYGISPGQHLKYTRLTNVRLWLLDETYGPRSVKDAAQANGFMNNGRFARYYRDMFGELPSETLAKSSN